MADRSSKRKVVRRILQILTPETLPGKDRGMNRIATFGLAATAAATLASCAPVGMAVAEDGPSPRQMALLEEHLTGKSAGEARRCLPSGGSEQMIRVSDRTLLYRSSGRLVWRNDLRSSCPGLERSDDIVVTEVHGNGPCSGDIFHLVDRNSGLRTGACVYGDFVPYRSAN